MSVTVRRIGNLNQYAIVLCRTEQGTATSSSGSQSEEQDYVEYAGQVGWGWGERREEPTQLSVCTYCHSSDTEGQRTGHTGELAESNSLLLIIMAKLVKWVTFSPVPQHGMPGRCCYDIYIYIFFFTLSALLCCVIDV